MYLVAITKKRSMLFDLDVFKTEILIHPQLQITLNYFSSPTIFFFQ